MTAAQYVLWCPCQAPWLLIFPCPASTLAASQAAEKEAKARVPPAEMFRGAEYAGQFKEYDDSGFPTVMADDQPVSKGMVKKLQKAREAQVKAYEQWQAAAQKDGGVVAGAAGEAER